MKKITKWWLTIDCFTLTMVLILMATGLLLVTAASPAISSRINTPSFYFVNKQMQFMLLALPCLILPSLIRQKHLRILSYLAFIIVIMMLFLLPFQGELIKGSRRWLNIGGFALQPSEFLKPFYVVVTAVILAKDNNNKFILASSLHIFVSSLLLLQPDFGMTITVTAVTGIQFFVAKLPYLWLTVMILIITGAIILSYHIFPHVSKRIDSFLFNQDINSYQSRKSLESYYEGGFFGKGPGEGSLKYMLPDSHTDFIFAVAGEELGSIFCFIIIVAIVVMVIRAIIVISNLSSQRDIYIAIGCVGYIAFQSIFNMAMTLHLLPTKGMTLPFISYGGSSLISTSLMMGIYLHVTRKNSENKLNRRHQLFKMANCQ